ncbi:hypothetical protein GQX73_g3058 [Xylaria multiplex]|uniref:Uncharacterized protein n=1 Tax=Xylaria multiplex TaxID=323545 RepID=A0A7C8MXG8_9PEZI|nr:hypothetical protein GQX73_g3058 [Xylaria multiplex]
MEGDLADSLAALINDGSLDLEAEDRLVIALDFGTTYSGIAYAFNTPGKKAEANPIVDWPGLEGSRQPKVPTLISYDPKDPNKFKWGGQLDWRSDAVQGVKLLLDPSQQQPIYVPTSNIKNELKKLPKDPVDVAADFMSAMYSHAISKIETVQPKEYVRMCQKQFVLSVPAVWSDLAKDRTLRAAKKAGIHPVSLIKEPEAAALYTLYVQERALRSGDAFVVCDAGGGTVDLITYQVITTEPSLKLAEVVPGKGGMAGSLNLNKRFAELVRNVVGDEQWVGLKKGFGWSKVANEFDKAIKRSFNGNLDEEHYITFPQFTLKDDPDEKVSGNYWVMTGHQVQEIFDPVITDIIRLIDDQVKDALLKQQGKNLRGIFLVGGFGESQYLKACIEKKIPDIQVIQPNNAWAAIVNGAVLSQLPHHATVQSTQAVRHYGVSAWMPYQWPADNGRPTRINPEDGIIRVQRNTWYIYIGEDLKRNHTVRFPFVRTFSVPYSREQLIFYDNLLTSATKIPPVYPGRDISINCTLKSDLTAVDTSLFRPKKGVDGKDYIEVNYDLVLSTDAANMKFSLEVNGKRCGITNANYE